MQAIPAGFIIASLAWIRAALSNGEFWDRAGAAGEPGPRCWLRERRRMGPVIRGAPRVSLLE